MERDVLIERTVGVTWLDVHLVEQEMGSVLPKEDLDISTSCEDLGLGNLKSLCRISNEVIREGASSTKRRSLQTKNIAGVGSIRAAESDRIEWDFVIFGFIYGLEVTTPETTRSDTNFSHEGFHRESHGTSRI